MHAGSFALRDVSFRIRRGTCTALMGPTGCGKTTLLEALCGLRQIRDGCITIGGEDVTRLKPGRRGIGYVPQDGALFSSMTIRRHLTLALRLRRVPKARARAHAEELARALRIEHLLARRPLGLSGGERQRVALGRVLAFGPQVLCLDEPLGALDDETREAICGLLEQVFRLHRPTCLLVTHSRAEAERLADTVLHVEGGRVVPASAKAAETSEPIDLVETPRVHGGTHARPDRIHSPAG